MSRTGSLSEGFVEVLPDGSIWVVFRRGVHQCTGIPITNILSLKPEESIRQLGMMVVCFSRYPAPGATEGRVIVFESHTVPLAGSCIAVSRRNLRLAAKRAGAI